LTDFQPGEEVRRFVQAFGEGGRNKEISWAPLAGDGSDRRFTRVYFGDASYVVVEGRDQAENRSYELIGRHLWRLDQAGPEFLAIDREKGLFLIEDLGDILLQDFARRVNSQETAGAYEPVISLMVWLHRRAARDFDVKWCYQTPFYDKTVVREREIGYFTEAFLDRCLGWPALSPAHQAEFNALAEAALKGNEQVFMHRDFQSRNVMLHQNRPRLVDFQGARLGPPGYDLASLLNDPYADLPEQLRERLLESYISQRRPDAGFNEAAFRETYDFLAVCRLLQALGAYAFLSQVKGKPAFKAYIPAALKSLDALLDTRKMSLFPALRGLIKDILQKSAP